MPSNPLLLSTAIEAVIKAGQIQMEFIDSGFKISKKGAIDLVTEADVAVETMFRELIAERFPATPFWLRNSGRIKTREARRTAGCSIQLTARTTTRTACRSSARRSRSRSTAGEKLARFTIRRGL